MLLYGIKAVVTGGSRGIGYQICKILLENGASVLAVSRDQEKLSEAKRRMPDLLVLKADISLATDTDRVTAWVQDNWGVLDVLVNNAGILPENEMALTNQSDEVFELTMKVNVLGPYLCTKRLLALLLKSEDPRIVNVGSTSGVFALDLQGAYSVSKVALHALTIATANELKGKVAVNALSPGWVRTDMSPDAPGAPRTSAESLLWLLNQQRGFTGKLVDGESEMKWSSIGK